MKFLKTLALAAALTFSLTAQATVFDTPYETVEGGVMDMAQFEGKVVLVAVTATQCGNTHQFGPLQTLWETYRDQGFVVLGIPTNDFGLEPRQGAAIKEFCETEFNASFPLTARSHVKGMDQHPFFKDVVADLGENALPHWNFAKYLVSREGKIIKMFPTQVQPLTPEITGEIEKALKM